MPAPEQHAEKRNFVESILRYIPGFNGYLEKEYRRDSDHLARTWMADRLQRSKAGLDQFMQQMVDALKLDELPQCERLRTKLDTIISRMRGDVRGYSGFFDYVRVDEELLERVYEHDMAMMEDVESLAAAIEGLPTSNAEPRAVLPELTQQLGAVEQKYNQRGEMLQGLGS